MTGTFSLVWYTGTLSFMAYNTGVKKRLTCREQNDITVHIDG